MKTHTSNVLKQYTIRNIPWALDQYLRKQTKATGRSFNQVVLDTLVKGTDKKFAVRTDFDFLIGTLTKTESTVLEKTIQALRTVDQELWEK